MDSFEDTILILLYDVSKLATRLEDGLENVVLGIYIFKIFELSCYLPVHKFEGITYLNI